MVAGKTEIPGLSWSAAALGSDPDDSNRRWQEDLRSSFVTCGAHAGGGSAPADGPDRPPTETRRPRPPARASDNTTKDQGDLKKMIVVLC